MVLAAGLVAVGGCSSEPDGTDGSAAPSSPVVPAPCYTQTTTVETDVQLFFAGMKEGSCDANGALSSESPGICEYFKRLTSEHYPFFRKQDPAHTKYAGGLGGFTVATATISAGVLTFSMHASRDSVPAPPIMCLPAPPYLSVYCSGTIAAPHYIPTEPKQLSPCPLAGGGPTCCF